LSLIRNIVVKVGADISGLSSGMVRARQDLEQNVDKMISAAKILATATAAAFTAVAAKGVEAASNLNEIQNVVEVAFGKSAAAVDAWSKTAINAYGLNQIEALRYASTLRAMFGSMGLASNAADSMSTSLAGLAGDIASFYNLDTDTAFEKIQSGISGEVEPLRQLGINMTQANLQAYALSQGISKNISSMSQAEQTTLRYNYLMNVTSMAQGDFARTSGSYANQMRVFQANIESLTVSLGQAVIPLIQAVLPWINMFAQALIGAATTFTQWVDSLLGIKTQTAAVTSSANALTSLSDASDSTSGSADSLAGSATNAAGGIDKVTKAAKAAKNAVSGIDELNILQKQSDTSGTTGGTGGESVISTPNLPSVTIPKGQQNINVGIIGADKIEAFKNACAAAWGWIVKYQDGIKTVASVITIFFLPALIRSTAQLVIQAAKGFISGAKAVIEYGLAGWRAVASMVAQAEALATKIGLWIAEKVQIAASTIATLAHEAATRASAAAQFVLSGALWRTVAAWVAGKVQIIAGVAAMIAQKVALVASTIATNAAAAAQWLLNAAMEANPIGLIILAVTALIAIFIALWNNNKGFRDFWINAWNGMKIAWDVFCTGIQALWKNILQPFGAFLWDLFCTRFQSIIDFVHGIIGSFKQVFNGLIEFFTGVFTGNWSRAFQGLKDIAGGIFSGIVNVVKLPINFLIDGINTVLKGVNGLAHAAAGIPGLSWLNGVSIPQIPRLAQGGIVSSPTIAMIGEAGTEAIVPLQNTGFITTMANAVAAAVGGAGGKPTGDINVTLEVDGVAFGKVCVKSINAQTRKLGVNPLYI
jgi:hypothetical protein